MLIPYVLLATPASIMSCVLVYENRLRFNAVFSALQTFFTMAVVLAVMVWQRSGWSMVAARSVMGSLFAVLTIYFAYSILPKEKTENHIQWKSIKALLGISIPLGLASMVGTVDKTLDQWIVSSMLTPEIYAVYVQGARELPLIGTITSAISTVLIVDLTKAVKDKKYPIAVSLFRTVSEKSSMLLMPIMVFFMAAARPFISFLYTDDFLGAVPIFQIYLLYLPIRVVQYSPFLIALGKSRFVLWKTVGGLVVNAALSVIFVLLFDAQGAALATILSLYIFNVPLNLYVISKETKISWKQLLPFKQMFQCILLSLPGAVGIMVLNTFLADALSAFWLLASDFVLFSFITGPLFVFKFHISLRKILTVFVPAVSNKFFK